MHHRALIAAALLAGALGSLHAFSVLLAPFERELGVSRAAVSLIYSTAIVCLTAAVLFAHRLQARLRPAVLALGVGVVAAAGLLLAAFGTRLAWPLIGYGVMFGGANGVGYSLALALAAAAWPDRKGLATGIVTAAYAGGAALCASQFASGLGSGGLDAALAGLAAAILGCAMLAALLVASTRVASRPREIADGRRSNRTIILLWAGYLCGAVAGLMAIGHAAGIVAAKGGSPALVAAGAAVIAVGNGIGSLLSGWITDRLPARLVLGSVAILAGLATLFVGISAEPMAVVAGLGAVGFAYGALIAIYPVASLLYFGSGQSARAFGRIFTAWGIAGLAGPWFAGAVYDRTGDYDVALAIAAALAAGGGILAAMLPPQQAEAV